MRPTAIVTGASAGIGAAIARQLAEDHDVVLVARRAEKLQALAESLHKEGSAHRVVALDLADRGSVDALVERVPTCDVLVNNAGVGLYAGFTESDPKKIDQLLDLNIRALVQLTRAYVPQMVARKSGGILNVASIGALTPTPGFSVYTASKSFVLAFSEALHFELKPHGVRVSCLCPGPTESEFMDQAGIDLEAIGAPKGVFQSCEEVARTGLASLRRNNISVVSGFTNKLIAAGTRFVPRSTVAWISGRVMAKKR